MSVCGTVCGTAPSIATATTTSSSRPPSMQPPVTGVKCWMECGTVEHLTNVGNGRSPKWLCGPCNSSRKALDRQAKDSTANKNLLVTLKNNQCEYKATVRKNRLEEHIKVGQGNSALARSLILERAKHIAHSFQATAEAVNEVAFVTDVLWMTMPEYIAHHVYTKGMTREEATVTVIAYNNYMLVCIFIYTCICIFIRICLYWVIP